MTTRNGGCCDPALVTYDGNRPERLLTTSGDGTQYRRAVWTSNVAAKARSHTLKIDSEEGGVDVDAFVVFRAQT